MEETFIWRVTVNRFSCHDNYSAAGKVRVGLNVIALFQVIDFKNTLSIENGDNEYFSFIMFLLLCRSTQLNCQVKQSIVDFFCKCVKAKKDKNNAIKKVFTKYWLRQTEQ